MKRRSLLKALGGLFAAMPVFPAIGKAKSAEPALKMDLAGGAVIFDEDGEIVASKGYEGRSDDEIKQFVSRIEPSRNSPPY